MNEFARQLPEQKDEIRASTASQDPLAAAFDEYIRRCESGEKPDREAFLSQFPELRCELADCLEGLEFVAQIAPEIHNDSASANSDEHPRIRLSALGDFRIVRELGRGGMGIVYEAEQVSLGRRVALKVLPFAAVFHERQLARFQNEALAAARLKHPHIVSVLTVGCDRGVHYYAMDLVQGQTLAQLVRAAEAPSDESCEPVGNGGPISDSRFAGPTDSSESSRADTTPVAALSTHVDRNGAAWFRHVAELGVQAAQALEYAHQMGIIHRDVKPSNLLVDRHGHLWVTDFGLAQIVGDHSLTLSGDILGTLRYMSPEQANGERFADPRTDVYSLGITLYELLTLHPAFDQTERGQLLKQVTEHEPPAPRKHNLAIPLDLERIVLKSISRSPNDRYPTAQELADDLQRFLEQRPIKARPLSRLARTWRWCRRSPAFAGLVAAVVLLALCVAAAGILLALRENKHRQQAEARTEEADWQQYLSDMHSAMAAWEQSNVGRTLELLERHRPKQGEPDLRGFEWHYLWRQCHDKRLKLTINETSFVRGLSFSHDNQMLATGNAEGLVRIWNATNGWLIHEFNDHQANVRHVAFSPDDRLLASADSDGKIHLRELADGRVVRMFDGHAGQILGLLFSTDGTQLASGCEDSTIRIWEVGMGRELRVIRPPVPALTNILPPWTQQRLWDFGSDGVLRLFDTETGAELRSIQRPELSLVRSTARVSWDGRMAATAGRDGVIRLLETETGHDLASMGGHGAAVRAMAFAPDNQTLASSDVYGKVILWDIAKRNPRAVLKAHSGAVWPIEFSNDGRLLCTSGVDHTLRIWNVSGQPLATDVCTGHNGLALCVAFSPDGRMIASGGSEAGGGIVILWDVTSGQLIHQFHGHTGWVWGVAFSPDGKELASTGADGTVRLWDLTQQRLRATIDTAKEYKSWVSYSLDGRQLITSETHGTLRVWDRSTGAEIRSAHIGESLAEKPALSPDGRYVVAGLDGSIVLLEFPSLKTVRRFPRSPFYGDTIAFSPDGRMIATCDEFSKHVYLSSLDGTPVGTFDHTADVLSVDFSPDGRSLITGDTNHEVHIWDVQRCQERATLRGHDAFVDAVRFSPDGKTIASSGDDGTIRLWRSESSD